MTIDLTHDGAAAVDRKYYWIEIDENTPRGTKLQLIHKPSGSACYGPLFNNNTFWTHWAPLPTFKKD